MKKKIFISYCWEKYDNYIETLATKLLEKYDVTFDKWEIKHGHNMDFFMEDSIREADKVFIFCEKEYVKKANNRISGVGVETSIISPRVYRNNKQEKFIPVFLEGISIKPDYLESIYGIDVDPTQKISVDKLSDFINAVEGKTILEKPNFDKKIELQREHIDVLMKVDDKTVPQKINEQIFDVEVYEKIKELVNKDLLSKFLVKYNLNDFGKIVLKFDSENQKRILYSIDDTFVEATGYNGWSNYDIFGYVAYHVAMNTTNSEIKKKAGNILEQCAKVRFNLQSLFEDYEMSLI